MRIFFVVAFFIINSNLFGQILSEESEISLLTASPGEELYSTFGHSAIRVKDPQQNLDIVFNFGTFDPDISNFYIKFARRKVDYMLDKSPFDRFILTYIYENRWIKEQVLNLDLIQKIKLYNQLIENFKPENRFYRYDFFFDNCATRIRDIMPTALGDDFSYHYPEEWLLGDMTFRNLIDLYLRHHHWSDFGIDLALGLPTDAIATPPDYMFLPGYLFEGFATATIKHGEIEEPLVVSTKEIIPRKDITAEVFFLTPMKLCWIIFILTIVVSWIGYKKQKQLFWFDMIYFSIIGLIGWAVFLLDFATDHIATKENLNMLWAVPLHFPVFLLWKKFPWRFRHYYVWVCLGISVIIIGSWSIFPQNYHNAFIPLILAMITRYFIILKFERTPDVYNGAVIT